MNLFPWIFVIIGVVSLLYFAIIVIYTKVTTAFGWFFIVVGAFNLVLFYIYSYLEEQQTIVFQYLEGISYVILLIGIITFGATLRTIVHCSKSSREKDVPYVIILGARINGSTITKSLKNRLDTALRYLSKNKTTVAIVSGGRGNGEDISEALAMKNYLVKYGIEESRIQLEDKSTNTNENLIFSSEFIKDKSKKVIIVTNSFHLYRALQIAKKQNYKHVSGLGAPTDKVLVVSYYIREVLAVIKDKLFGNMI